MNEDFNKGQMDELTPIETSDEVVPTEVSDGAEYSAEETSEEKTVERRHKVIKTVRNIAVDFCIAVLLVVVFLTFFQPNLVYQESMYPTYTDRDVILVSKTAYRHSEPQRGDIIVFNSYYEGNKRFIKRVIGVENDRVSIHDGKVWVNDVEQNQSYTNKGVTDGNLDVTVPEGSCFVLGDNRTVSIDSRDDNIGFIDYDDIIGKVMFAKDVVLDKGAE